MQVDIKQFVENLVQLVIRIFVSKMLGYSFEENEKFLPHNQCKAQI